ncbi:hypothetical protein AX14_014451 [Amanita brunnescens Koide BX004]|nr:hypothetical protein AX14_014451 [Amanita brunnescens Koide BX004]
MRTPTIFAFLSLAAFSQAVITIVNDSTNTIYAAVGVISANEDSSYYAISPGKSDSWTREAPGLTALIVRATSVGPAVETVFIPAGQTLYVS